MSLQRILCILIACLVITQGVMAAGNTWTERTPTASTWPLGRMAYAYDEANDKLVVFGGKNGTGNQDSTWVYDYSANSWTLETPANSPPALTDAAMAYDSKNERIILMGGNVGATYYQDTWVWNGTDNEWYNVTNYTMWPDKVTLHKMVYDSVNERIISFGGTAGGAGFQKTWIYNYTDSSWISLSPATQPDGRYAQAMAYDSDNERVILFGGTEAAGRSDETWIYNYTDGLWYNVSDFPGSANQSDNSGMVYDSFSERTILFEGQVGAGYINKTFVYNLTGNTWTDMGSGTAPTPRNGMGIVYSRSKNRVLLFGGYNGTYNNETWEYHFSPTDPPNLDYVGVNATTPIGEEDLLISLNGTDWDGDNVNTYVNFFKDDVFQFSILNSTTGAGTVNNTVHFLSGNLSGGEVWTFQGIISDGTFNSTTSNVSVYVIDEPSPYFTWSPAPSHMSDVIIFNATTVNPPGSDNTTAWEWDWGDDFNATNGSGQMNTTHMYRWQPGTFNVVYNVTNYWGFKNATHRTITVSGIRVMAFLDATPDTNTSFNITISNSTDSYTEDLTGSGVFIWRNNTNGIPTGSVTVKVSKTNYEDSVSFYTFDSTHFINLTAFLASSTDCVTQPFQVIDQNADPIDSVTITINKTIGGISQTVTELSTDGTGYTSACLDPTDLHTFKAEKTGYSSLDWTSLNPSTTTRTIKLALIQEGGGFIGLNNTWYVLLFPPTPRFNVTRDQLTGVMNEPRCSAVWWEINITNETGTPYSWKTLTNPCYAINTIIVNTTTGLKDLPVGSKFTVSFFEYSNATEGNHTKNYTMISTGALSTASIQNFLEFVSVSFSQTTLSFLALILAMVIGGTVSRLVGFGGIFVIIICTMFATMGAFGWDVYLIAAIPALASYLGKRWT